MMASKEGLGTGQRGKQRSVLIRKKKNRRARKRKTLNS